MINPFYTLRCYGRHEIQTYYKGKDKLELLHEGWKRFNYSFDIHYSIIVDYKEYVLFDSPDDTGTRCIKVTFEDYSYVYAAYSLESFEKWLEENYLPLYNNINHNEENKS